MLPRFVVLVGFVRLLLDAKHVNDETVDSFTRVGTSIQELRFAVGSSKQLGNMEAHFLSHPKNLEASGVFGWSILTRPLEHCLPVFL